MAFCTKADGDRVAAANPAAARRMKRGDANLARAIPASTWELAARADVGGRRPGRSSLPARRQSTGRAAGARGRWAGGGLRRTPGAAEQHGGAGARRD